MNRVLLFLVFCTALVSAQQWRWPDKPKNLKVLPDSAAGERLHAIMDSYTNGLGVRCTFCHVGEDGKPFSEFDFPSDQLPMKEITRQMIRMTNTVNTTLKDIFKGGTEAPVEVTCATCHHGSAIPQKIEDVLWRKYELKGITETVALYRDMRSKFYGSYTYDFREGVLLAVANRCQREKNQTDDAVTLLELNTQFFPDAPRTLTRLASLYIERKEPQKAKPLIEKVLAADPNDRFAKRLQEQIGK